MTATMQKLTGHPFRIAPNSFAAQGGLDDGVHFTGVEAVSGRLVAVHLDVEIGLTKNPKNTEISHAPDLIHFTHDLDRDLFELHEFGTDDLDGVGALHAG